MHRNKENSDEIKIFLSNFQHMKEDYRGNIRLEEMYKCQWVGIIFWISIFMEKSESIFICPNASDIYNS